MGAESLKDPTEPIRPNSSDPLEIARRHRQQPPDPERIPDRIGPYKVLSKLNEGGMGVVYLAEQGSPDRKVAIKIIHPHRRTKEILARFDIEREALAIMDHPHIAKVYDAGETEDGRPYFVMDYIRGIPITEYCDKNKLTTDERLRLFRDVCRAVHHAHQKGIIHRDIKPGNILVCVQDDRPMPKVIDFGVAKAVGHQLTQRTVFTEIGQLIGTPGYMSPEQAEMGPLDIDTRTDVYSLGVLLYELLVGAQPFDARDLLAAGYEGIRHVIRDIDPPKPSTKLSSMGEDSTVVAANRHTAVRSLTRQLRGDLDWITMKCLEKDRVRRYRSADALAEDIERHMKGEPVSVGPPSAIYKLRKFTRRHRFGVTSGLGIAAAILAGFIGTAVQYLRAEREAVRAEEKAATATEVTNFMIDLFKVNDPDESRGNSVTAREVLESGEKRIRNELANQPLVRAAFMDAIGNVYSNLGLYEPAETLLREAVNLRKRELPDPSDATAAALHHLGVVLDRRGKYASAISCHREGLAIRQQLHPRTHLDTAESLFHLASSLYNNNQREEAESLYGEVLAIRRKLLPPDDPRIATVMFDVGSVAHARGELDFAKRQYEAAAEIYAKSSMGDHRQAADCRYNLADIAFQKKDYGEAQRLYDEVLASYQTLYGAEHPQVTSCLIQYANLLAAQELYDQAEPMAQKALAINLKKLGPDHEVIAANLNLLGAMSRGRGDYANAEKYNRASLDMRLRLVDNAEDPVKAQESEGVAKSRTNLGFALLKLSRFEEAERELKEALRSYESMSVPASRLVKLHQILAELYEAWNKPDEAEVHRQAATRFGQTNSPAPP